jgi:hypothetical protein
MLFMVVERFKDADPDVIGDRFRREGRMLPADVTYLDSWMDVSGTRCYQLMEAPSAESMSPWTTAWGDLVEFEIVPVVASAEFWEAAARKD